MKGRTVKGRMVKCFGGGRRWAQPRPVARAAGNRLTAILVVPLAVATLATTAVATAAMAATEPVAPEQVVFTALSTGCGTRPEPDRLEITTETPLELVNESGKTLILELNQNAPTGTVKLKDGEAVTIMLAAGAYELRLPSRCKDAVPLMLTVRPSGPAAPTIAPTNETRPAGPPAPPPPPSPPPAAPSGIATTGAGIWVTPTRPGRAAPEVPDATVTGAAVVSAPGGPEWAQALPPASGIRVVEGPYPINRTDRRGVRLLAIIGAICVFGVTVGIIRAIVAQRSETPIRL